MHCLWRLCHPARPNLRTLLEVKQGHKPGRASVAMLLEAMRHAHKGCERFDFGGSQDPGVDQFYAEFGSEVVFMRRWVRAPRWFQWLFPRTWQSWTRPSAHK